MSTPPDIVGGGEPSGISPADGEGNTPPTKPIDDMPVARPVNPTDDEDDLIGDPGDVQESYSSTSRCVAEEVVSLEHLMDHYPKNLHCQSCHVGKT